LCTIKKLSVAELAQAPIDRQDKGRNSQTDIGESRNSTLSRLHFLHCTMLALASFRLSPSRLGDRASCSYACSTSITDAPFFNTEFRNQRSKGIKLTQCFPVHRPISNRVRFRNYFSRMCSGCSPPASDSYQPGQIRTCKSWKKRHDEGEEWRTYKL
jgi:hypothetical protein